MSHSSEKSGASDGGFLSQSTRALMNPNSGREGLPQLGLQPDKSFSGRTARITRLLEVASSVRDSFIESPKSIQEETAEMSPSLKEFLATYPQQGVLTNRRLETTPVDAQAYTRGMQLAHRIYREADILPDITADDVNLIRMQELGTNIYVVAGLSQIVGEFWKDSSDGLRQLGEKVKELTAGLPDVQGRSVELAFRHLGSIVGRKENHPSFRE